MRSSTRGETDRRDKTITVFPIAITIYILVAKQWLKLSLNTKYRALNTKGLQKSIIKRLAQNMYCVHAIVINCIYTYIYIYSKIDILEIGKKWIPYLI